MTTSTTLTRRLGDAEVFPIGLGEMPLSLKGRPDEDRAIRTIHAALDAGVNLIDTADAYAYDGTDMNHGERLIAKALKGRRDGVIVATKGGHQRDGQAWPVDGRPEHIRAACEASLRALETDRIDLYQFHRPDPRRAVRGVDRRVPRAPGRGQGPLGRDLQRERRPDRGGARHRRRRRGPEPARARLHLAGEQGRARRSARSAGSPSCPGRRSAASARRAAPRRTTR